MSDTPLPSGSAAQPKSALVTIFWAGLISGILDITYASTHTLIVGRSALAMWRFIAGGLLGPEAIKDTGFGMSLFGLFLHFVIAFGAAAVFYGLSRFMGVLVRRPVISGLLYGIVVWLVMNLVVLRLSAYHVTKFPPTNWIPNFIAHLFCVGLTIALITARCSRPTAERPPATV